MVHTEIPRIVSEAQIHRLEDFRSILLFRAEQARGFTRRALLEQANKVNQNIELCCGKGHFKYRNLKKNINDNK